jgi:ribonuclease Z
MNLDLTILGTAASVPTEHRGLPAILVRAGGDQILFDCGEGTQRQLMRNGGLPDLDAIFLTHYHLDHWFGLVGLIKSFDLRERDKPLTIYGPYGLDEKMKMVRALSGRVNYEIVLHEYWGNIVNDAVQYDGYQVVPFLVDHRKLCFGLAVIEDNQPGRVDAVKAKALGLTGPQIGALTRGEMVIDNGGRDVLPTDVIGEARWGRRIVYSGDTRPTQSMRLMASGADVLIHEATFLGRESERAHNTGHTTARDAVTLAKNAGARMTLLTHLSSRYGVGEYLNETLPILSDNMRVAADFDTVTVPPPDKGIPLLRNESR